MKRVLSIILLLTALQNGYSQVGKSPEDVKLYYRSSVAYGFTLHTQGIGASFKYQQHLSYKVKRFYTFNFQNLKHPKQEKVVNAFDDNAKGFFYGKINALMNARFGIGEQRAIALKEVKKGVQIAWVYSGGFNLGLQKPVYLEVYNVDGNNQIISERYDPEKHTMGTIYGRASVFKGVDEIEFVPGLFGKFGLNFEYSPYDQRLKALEVGVAVDWFYKEIPMMYNTYNSQYWITFYLMLELGKKIE